MAIRPPAGQQYRLTNLVDGLVKNEARTHELGISELVSRGASNQLRPLTSASKGAFLPSQTFVRSLGIGTASSGGNLISGGIAAVATAARPELVLEALGAQRFEGAGNSGLSLPAFRPSTGSGWVGEDAAAPELTVSVESVEASGRMACARIAYSRRLRQMAGDSFEAAILEEITAEVRRVVETGLIAGTGSNSQPLGIINAPGIGSATFAAAVPTKGELLTMADTFAAHGNLSTARYLVHPSDAVALLNSGAIAWLDNAWRVCGIPAVTTNHIPEGKVLLMDPSTIGVIFFGPPQLVVDASSNGKSIRGDTELIILNLCDIAIRNRDLCVVGSV